MSLYIFTSLVALGSMVIPGAALTVPNGLEKRVPNALEIRDHGDSPAEAIQMWIDCAGGPRVCNVDCYSILCLGGPNPVQRAEGENSGNRKLSGYTIFKHGQADRESRHVFVDDSVLQEVGNSGEESIMANTVQGGRYEIVYPVDPTENRNIGSSVSGQLSHLGVTDAHPWYFKHFTNYPAGTAPYCDVLERPEGFPAWDELQRICTKKGKPKTDPAWCAVSRDWTQVGPRNKNMYKMMDFDAGIVWPGKGLGTISRRDPTEDVDGAEEH